MTWTNAFDAGECTVSVYTSESPIDEPVFSGVMGSGDSQEFEVSDWGSFSVSVSDAGIVTLEGSQRDDDGGYMIVVVVPHNVDVPMRVSGITADVGQNSTMAVAIGSALSPTEWSVVLDGEGSNWTPDPCNLPDGSPGAGIYAAATGI